MERVHSPHTADNTVPETMGPLPETQSLASLLSAVRSPGRVRADVDALMRGLGRPLASGESPRSRADFLLAIIDFEEVSSLEGSEDTSVGTAAVRALIELGYPYALEVPPEALARARGHQEEQPLSIPVLGIIASLAGLAIQSGYALPPSLDMIRGQDASSVTVGLMLFCVLLGPTFASVVGGLLRMPGMQRFGLVTMVLTGCVWLLISTLALIIPSHPFTEPFTYLSLIATFGFLAGPWLTRRSEWVLKPEAPQAAPPPETEP